MGSPSSPMTNKQLREIPPVRIFFLRHAISENNANVHNDMREGDNGIPIAKTKRQADPLITPLGALAFRCAGGYFRNLNADDAIPEHEKIGSVYSSLMKRAVRSVEELGLVPDVPYYALPMLYEEGGLFEGTRDDDPADHPPVHGITRDEVALSPAYPVNIDEIDWSAEGGWWPGGREDSSSIDRRVHEIADYLWKLVERRTKADETESKRGLLVVTHGLIHDRLKRLLITGSPAPTSAVFFPTSNAGIDVLDFKIHPQTSERMLAVIQLNNDAYLPPELRNGHTCGPFTIKYAN